MPDDGLVAFILARLDEDEAMVAEPHIWPTTFRPERVLRDVEAKRQIIRWHEVASAMPDPIAGFTRGMDEGYLQACLDAIRALAAVWSDHPDYRPEWKP